MAGTLAILAAVRHLVWRDLNTLFSLAANNLFFFVVPIAQGAAMVPGGLVALIPFVVFVGVLLFVPLTSDPLHKISAARLALWPLSARDHVVLRVGSAVISPAFWLALLLFAVGLGSRGALFFAAMALAVQGISALLTRTTSRVPALNPLRSIPQFPSAVGGLVRIALRQLLSVLDFYAAAIIAVAAMVYRFANPHADPEAFPICAILVALALSTVAQRQFGLDGPSGIARYRLMPLRGWQLVFAKDLALLGTLLVMVVLLDAGAGMTFGFTAAATGRYAALRLHAPQQRWRFTRGDVRFGILQLIAGLFIAVAYIRIGWWFFAVAAVAYAVSVVVGGWWWEHGGVRAAA